MADFIIIKERAVMADNDSPLGFLPDLEPSIIQEVRNSHHSTSSPQISQLIHSDNKLQQKVEELNAQGLVLYQDQNFQQALQFFGQCEKILEYAANCGNSIDCNHIITILRNQAATYQALNDTEKAARYVQAIVYNLTTLLNKKENAEIVTQMQEFVSKSSQQSPISFLRENYQIIRSYLTNLFYLGQYYLQYSGLSSQNQLHKESLQQARKALSTLKELCLRCHQYQCLHQNSNQQGKSLLKELGQAKEEFTERDIKSFKEEYRKIAKVFPDNNQVYHSIYDCLPFESKLQIQETDIHSLFDLTPESLSESLLEQSPMSHHYNIEICTSHFHHIKKILTMMGAYFAIGVELEEIDTINSQLYHTTSQYEYSEKHYSTKKNKNQAQVMLIASLNLSYRYIPAKTELSQYLLELYQEGYPQQSQKEDENMASEEIMTETCQTEDEKGDKKESLIESIVKEYNVEASGSQLMKQQTVMKVSINLLTQKYKNYMIDKDYSLEEESPSHEEMARNIQTWKQQSIRRSLKGSMKGSQEYKKNNNWDEEKKQSKKLANLFNTDQHLKTQNTLMKPNYLNQVASIDSISIANSQSAQQHSISQKRPDPALVFKHPKAKLSKQVKIKQIPECESSIQQTITPPEDRRNQERREGIERRFLFSKKKNSESKSFRKSKSTKVLKSKSKEPKEQYHRIAFTQKTIPSVQDMTSTDRSANRIKNKKSPSKSKKISNLNDFGQLLRSEKQRSGQNDILFSRGYNSTRSVKNNLNSIKFHRVKSPPRTVLSSQQSIKLENGSSKASKMARVNNVEMLTSINEKPPKAKSKNKSTREGTKKQSKSKSVSSTKSINKMMKASHPTIYTSVNPCHKKR